MGLKFPEVADLTPEQVRNNQQAGRHLVQGRYYLFNPPITATAIPVAGPEVCAQIDCLFHRGWYLGERDGKHVFQGRPINDRQLPVEILLKK